jgi:hypothetical protein
MACTPFRSSKNTASKTAAPGDADQASSSRYIRVSSFVRAISCYAWLLQVLLQQHALEPLPPARATLQSSPSLLAMQLEVGQYPLVIEHRPSH